MVEPLTADHIKQIADSLQPQQRLQITWRFAETRGNAASEWEDWSVVVDEVTEEEGRTVWVRSANPTKKKAKIELFLFPNADLEYAAVHVQKAPCTKQLVPARTKPAPKETPVPKAAPKPASAGKRTVLPQAPRPPSPDPSDSELDEEEEEEPEESEEEGEAQDVVGFMMPHHVQNPASWIQFPLEELRTAMRTRYLGGPNDSYTEVVAQDLIHCCLLLRAGAPAERIALRMVEHLESIAAYRHCQSVDGVAQFRRSLAAQDMTPPFKKAWAQLERGKPKTPATPHSRNPTPKASNSRGDLFLGRTGWEKLSDAERKQLASIRKKVKGQ